MYFIFFGIFFLAGLAAALGIFLKRRDEAERIEKNLKIHKKRGR